MARVCGAGFEVSGIDTRNLYRVLLSLHKAGGETAILKMGEESLVEYEEEAHGSRVRGSRKDRCPPNRGDCAVINSKGGRLSTAGSRAGGDECKAAGRHSHDLFEHGKIDLRRGAWFDTSPDPMPAGFDFDRVKGMMLGLAIGDSLGNTTEGMLPGARRDRFGEIRNYLPNRHADEKAIGLPSDDTQLAFWTLEQMIADKGFDPDHVAERFCRDQIFGIGSTVSRFRQNYQSWKALGREWSQVGGKRGAHADRPHGHSPSQAGDP